MASEDLIARRVIRGMGFVERQLYDLEKALQIRDTADTPLWPRTLEVFRQLALRSGVRKFGYDKRNPGLYEIEVREVGLHHKEIYELMPAFENIGMPPYPLFLTRVKGMQTSLAYFMVPGPLMAVGIEPWLKPPFTALREVGSWWLVAQDTTAFISQFGPYKSPIEEE